MTTSEERVKILDMIRDGKLSAEDGTRLLQALHTSAKKSANKREAQQLRVRVTDIKTGKSKVSVNLPMNLVNIGIKLGARFAPKDSSFDAVSVMEAIKSGAVGKIVDVEDEDEHVEIWVE